MKTLFISLSILLFAGCGTKKISGDGTGQTIEMKAAKNLKATTGKVPVSTSPVTITSARIEGNTMIIGVSYPGGCGEHDFSLIGSESIAKSLPPIRSVNLVHTTETPDNCKAMIMKTLEFDISDLAYKQEKGSEIILTLDGWDGKLGYIYE